MAEQGTVEQRDLSSFDSAKIDRQGLRRKHRLAMIDCILAWASFDSQFRAMITAVEQRPLDEGARDYGRLPTSVGWTKLRQALRDRGATPEVLERINVLRKGFDHHVQPRNFIAHAGCIGTWREDADYIVFAPFEATGDGMTILRVPLEEIERSTRWAKAAGELADRILRASGH